MTASPLRAFAIVTGHELVDAFRSKRAIILIILYLMGAVGATLVFINILHGIEAQMARAAGLTPSSAPGSTTHAIWQSEHFRNIVGNLVDDEKLVDHLLAIPPIALFYSWLAFTFTPMLIVLLVSSRIAEEVSTASVRFVLVRTTRATWCMGKLAGQAIMLAAALLISAAGTWVTAWIRLKYFDPGPAGLGILYFSMKAWIYAMAYLGLALGVSQLFRSPVLATAFSLLGMMILSSIAGISMFFKARGDLVPWNLVHKITPNGHIRDLWHPDPVLYLPASVMLLALCFAYFITGYARFSRRDQ